MSIAVTGAFGYSGRYIAWRLARRVDRISRYPSNCGSPLLVSQRFGDKLEYGFRWSIVRQSEAFIKL